jgi:membrane associated rhomboid family serine protease
VTDEEGSARLERLGLRGRPEGVVLEAEGFHHPRSPRGHGRTFTRYSDITHLARSDRFVWVASRRAVHMFSRRIFRVPGDAERLLHALVERIREQPGGLEQLAHIAKVEALAARPASPLATWGLALLCVAGFLLEMLAGPHVFTVGYFSSALVADGDLWRLVTANLLHGFPLHLAINLVGLLMLGRMAERALGTSRTICVIGVSALGSMLASGLLLRGSVVGVSGVVFGLAGAVLWLELRRGGDLPAWWRFPRPLLGALLVAFLLDVALGFFLPIIAGEAHLGGFVAGIGTAAVLARRGGLGAPAAGGVRFAAAAVTAVAALAVLSAGVEVMGEGDYAARHAARLAGLADIEPEDLNNHAWFIAVDSDATRAQLEAALLLAQRAVDETEGREATMLDTLAEVQFQLGWRGAAISTIDAAIARDPEEPYYREQRRRFTGERSPDDRPPDPAFRPHLQPDPSLLRDEDGLRV